MTASLKDKARDFIDDDVELLAERRYKKYPGGITSSQTCFVTRALVTLERSCHGHDEDDKDDDNDDEGRTRMMRMIRLTRMIGRWTLVDSIAASLFV